MSDPLFHGFTDGLDAADCGPATLKWGEAKSLRAAVNAACRRMKLTRPRSKFVYSPKSFYADANRPNPNPPAA